MSSSSTGEKMKVYQFVAEAHPGLVTDLPAEFANRETTISQIGSKLLDRFRKQ